MVQSQEDAHARQLRIGEVAHRARVSIDTIRYYERRGVLGRAGRTESGYRTFDESVVERLALVRQLRDLGFLLDEIVDALRAHDAGTACCESERWRLVAVEERIDAKLAELRATKRAIHKALTECEKGRCSLRSRAG